MMISFHATYKLMDEFSILDLFFPCNLNPSGIFCCSKWQPEALSGSPMGFYRPYSAVVGFQQGESEEEDMEATLGVGG